MGTFIVLNLLVAAAFAGSLPLIELEGRITNGDVAIPGQFPYQALLALHKEGNISWCGGTIISDRWILSAGHCTSGASALVAFLGHLNTTKQEEEGRQRIEIQSKTNIVTHANFDLEKIANDISLIKLPVPIEFNEFIQPAVLPKKTENKYLSYEGKFVWASGWGIESDNSTNLAQVLRFIEVPVAKNSECNSYYVRNITDKMICIETPNGKSPCRGDSGGPLVYKDNNFNILVGVSSFGDNYCERDIPSVYTRVTAYLDWIEEVSGIVNQ